MSGWNLPPGCSTYDIDRAAGVYDEEPVCEHGENAAHTYWFDGMIVSCAGPEEK